MLRDRVVNVRVVTTGSTRIADNDKATGGVIGSAATGGAQPDGEGDVLRGACRVLAGLVGRTAGADVLVSAGPDHGRAVRLRNRDGELTAELVSGSDDAHPGGATTEVIGTQRTTATAIASLLWSGGIGDGNVPPPDGSQEGQQTWA